MTSADSRHRPLASVAAACAAAFLLLAPGVGASVVLERPAGGDLSPRLAELAKPSVRSLSRAAQAQRLGVARGGPGSLLRRGGRVLVEVRFDRGAAASVEGLRGAGAKLVDVSRRYQTVTAAVSPADLRRVGAVAGVRSVTEVLTPIVHSAAAPGPITSAFEPCFGLETSEGYEQLRADEAQAEFEVEGGGVKVGVLSDSFDQDVFAPTGAAEDVASGDLPGPGNPCGHTTPVEVLDDPEAAGADEGRAMAQIVHDLAPGAALSFATAFSGEFQFADNIRALATNGAEAIVDDVTYFEEPFFQEGPVGVAVSDVSEEDVAYYSSAGNDNLIEAGTENEIGSWEAPAFRDSGSCPAPIAALGSAFNPSHCMDFNPGGGVDQTFGITVEPGELLILDLQWAEPWEGVTTDLDAFLLDEANQLVGGSVEENSFSQRPLEIPIWENESGLPATVRLVINRYEGASSPRLKFVLLQNGGGVSEFEYPESSGGDVVGPTIFGHNGAEDAMTVGAIRYTTKTEPEGFSSRGPVTHYFGPVDGLVPAAPLGSPLVLEKPDVVATDGGASTFFGACVGVPSAWRFFGTSAAAPHATAVAALARGIGGEPAATAAVLKEAQRDAAVPVGAFPPSAVGFGLVDTVGTLEELGVTPPAPGAPPAEAPPAGPCLPPREPVSPPPSSPPPVNPITGAADTIAPNTLFRKRPPRIVRTRTARARVLFVLGSNESDVSFACRIDGGLFRTCPQRLARRFPVGWHAVRAFARDAAGNADPTPAVYRFRVKRIQ